LLTCKEFLQELSDYLDENVDAEAKAKLSEVIDRALSEGPQTITRNGRTTVVVVGADEWQRKTQRVGNLAEFFAASPLRGSGLRLRRSKEQARKIHL